MFWNLNEDLFFPFVCIASYEWFKMNVFGFRTIRLGGYVDGLCFYYEENPNLSLSLGAE